MARSTACRSGDRRQRLEHRLALPPIAGGIDIDDGGGDNVRVGDLIMLTRNGLSTLLYVAVNGATGQTVTFTAGDPFQLNQFNQLRRNDHRAHQRRRRASRTVLNARHAAGTATRASRIRMLTYYVHIDPRSGQPAPVAAGQQRARPAAQPERRRVRLEQFRLTYDLAERRQQLDPTSRMDRRGPRGGRTPAAAPRPAHANQIRKVNVVLAMRSRSADPPPTTSTTTPCLTQVSLRSMAFVDRYR